MKAEYVISAAKADQLPAPELPEVAFIGRSNTGKSSLINALTGHKNLAFASKTPGRTQMANFFRVNDKIMFVDLPGYGFSATGPQVREHWQKLLDKYSRRPNLTKLIFLTDIRRDWVDEDVELAKYFAAKLPIIVVLTKADKLSKAQQNKQLEAVTSIVKEWDIACQRILAVSVLKKLGIDELKSEVLT